MVKPWENPGPSHETKEIADGIYECQRCGKMATNASKLQMTVCNDNDSS